ncbi:unnamed protein product, partial [Meganyctiphanes norvegica]
MVAMLVGVVVLAALEADHILKSTFIAMTTSIPGSNHNIPTFDKSKVFDLRPINQHESKNILAQKNGYINGHTHVENLKSYPNCNNINKKSSSVLNILSTAGRSYSGSNNNSNSNNNINNNNNNHNNIINNNNKKGNNPVTISSTKQKLQKQNSDPKYSQNTKDTTGITDINNHSRKSRNKSNKKNESSFLANILASVVGKKDYEHSVLRERKTSQSSGHNDSGVERLSVATETDIQIDEHFSKTVKKRSKQCNEEETSSTTTESSNTDELSISERETSSHKSLGIASSSNSSVGKCKKKGNKGKSNNNRNCHSTKVTYGIHEDDPGFEITNTKIKGERKKKDTSNRTNYGDIYQPSTLELPYTLKPLRNKESDREKENRRNNKNKLVKNNESSESIGSGRSSPPSPSWDESQRSGNENLSDIGSQNFNSYKRSQIQPQPLAPRESYSAILLGADKQKAKVTPFAKIPPEKRIEKPLGAIGQKIGNTNIGVNGGGFNGVPGSIGNLNHTNSLFSNLETLSHAQKEEAFARSLYSNGYNEGNALPTATTVSTHSWDPQTLSAPPMSRHPPPGLSRHDTIRRHSTLSEEDWNRNNYLWEGKGYQADPITMSGLHPHQMSVAPTPPSPGLWDSLPSLWYPSFRGGNATSPPHSAPPLNNNMPVNSSPWAANFSYEQQAMAQASQMVIPHENSGGSPPKGLWFDPLRSHGSIWASDNFWSPTAAIPK